MKIRFTATAIAVATAFPASAQVDGLRDGAVMPATVVTATRQAQRVDEVLASVDVITREDIERSSGRTLTELLGTRPGIQISTNGGAGANTSVFIRGANANQTLLLIDGMRIGSATNGAPSLETIPLALIERIEILRGPASALYGADAVGGVIQIFTRRDVDGVVPRAHFGAGRWDSYTASAGVAGGTGRLRYNLDVGHDRSRGFDAQPESFAGTDADRDGWRNDFVNATVALGFRERDDVSLNYWDTDGRNRYDNAQDFDSFLDKRSQVLGLTMSNALAEGWRSTVRLGQSRDELTNRSNRRTRSHFDTRQRQFMWQHDIDVAGGNMMLAYEELRQRVDSSTDFVETDRTTRSWLAGWGGQFGRHDVQFNLRRDRITGFGSHDTGNIAYGYQLTDALRLVAGYGTSFRAPSFNDLYWPADPVFGGGGNPDLEPEEGRNRELGLRWDDGKYALGVTYFNNRVSELIAGWPPVNINTAKLEGVEVAAGTRLADVDLEFGWDWLNARDTRTDNWLPRRARHSGHVRALTRIASWRVGGELTGQGRRYNDVANKQRMGGYVLANLTADYDFTPDWRLELRANNIFDKRYALAQDFRGRDFGTPRRNLFAGLRYAPR
ncbi:TonB-dependent receptor domain-containing protein [Rhodocyclaceae bacterium SMB388]